MFKSLFKSKALGSQGKTTENIQNTPQRADWAKVSVSLFVACFVVLISLTEIVRLPELLTYDKLVFLSYEKPQKNHTLLLEVNPQDLAKNPALLTQIIDNLLTRDPKQILLMNPLDQFTSNHVNNWLKNERVDYVPTIFRTFLDGGEVDFKYRSPNTSQAIKPLGFALPADSDLGITRTAPLVLVTNTGEKLKSFQSVLSATDPKAIPSIYINFNQGSAPIPRYTAENLLEIGIIEELVKDKTVFIIPTPEDFMPGLVTPKNNYLEPLLPYYTQAMMLNSLLNQTDIQMLKTWQVSVICFVIFFTFLFAFQWLNMSSGILVILASGLSLVALDWYLLSFHYYYLPIFSFIVSIMAALFTSIPLHRISEQGVLNALRLGIISQLKSSKITNNFYQAEDPWGQIIVFINLHLQLNRSILLERVEQDHRVKEIKSLGCSIDDIAELRRDYTRYPYDQALQQNLPFSLQDNLYFKESIEGEKQFLIPLRFEDSVLGFWAFTVLPDESWDQNKFFSNINIFAKQIGLLLHNRSAFKKEININNKLLTQLLNFNLGMNNHKYLKSAIDSLGHRLKKMEGIFDGMSSAAILYDLFGNVISSNHLMDQLSRDFGLSIYDLTSLDLISQACDINLDDARGRLRHVTMTTDTIDLPIAKLIDNRQYLLRIQSIAPKVKAAKNRNDNALPFELLGILFEFINVTPIQQKFNTDVIVYENLNALLRNNLSSLSLCQMQLKLSSSADPKLLATMDKTIQNSAEIVSNAEKLLSYTSNSQANMAKLLHPLDILNRALIELKDSIAAAKLTFKTDLPTFTSLIFINEDALSTLIIQSLELLIQDAVPDTDINISLREQQREDNLLYTGSIVLCLSNTGYGMPQKELNAEKKDSSYIESDSLSLFKKAIMNASTWQVLVTSTSHVGSGFEINIELPATNFYTSSEAL